MADASVQDHADTQFPGVYNDAPFLWAMVDTEDGKRYELIRELSASAAFDVNLHECSTAHSEMKARHRMRISLGPHSYVRKDDEDCIDVVMTPLPMNVTAIYVPGLPDDVGYTNWLQHPGQHRRVEDHRRLRRSRSDVLPSRPQRSQLHNC